MSDHHHHSSKKEKKLLQILKNRRTQRINMAEEQHGRERDLEKERDEKVKKSAKSSSRGAAERAKQDAEPAWSARMQQVRDRNTGRLRTMDERWNRFSGTESAGARGR